LIVTYARERDGALRDYKRAAGFQLAAERAIREALEQIESVTSIVQEPSSRLGPSVHATEGWVFEEPSPDYVKRITADNVMLIAYTQVVATSMGVSKRAWMMHRDTPLCAKMCTSSLVGDLVQHLQMKKVNWSELYVSISCGGWG
jgi:hypothetical protein